MNASQIIFPIISIIFVITIFVISVVFTFFPRQTVEYSAAYFERKNVYGLKPRHDIRGEWVVIYVRAIGATMLLLVCCFFVFMISLLGSLFSG